MNKYKVRIVNLETKKENSFVCDLCSSQLFWFEIIRAEEKEGNKVKANFEYLNGLKLVYFECENKEIKKRTIVEIVP